MVNPFLFSDGDSVTFQDHDSFLNHYNYLVENISALKKEYSISKKAGGESYKKFEEYAHIIKLYRVLSENGQITFPLKFVRNHRPDFIITEGDRSYGLEVTIATEEDYSIWLKKTEAETGSLIFSKKGIIGSEQITKTIRLIGERIDKKTEKLPSYKSIVTEIRLLIVLVFNYVFDQTDFSAMEMVFKSDNFKFDKVYIATPNSVSELGNSL